ncbi:MAG: sigma-70 family RNA polymerase sigma factor [Dysgonomonas sp.]|nr:sigma-70 family RNA polymerase sigma factor [Dysgonomonas sp.]
MHKLSFDKNKYSDLWTLFVNGEDDAFAEIYKSSYRMLYSYGLSFKIPEEQVRDLIQDLFFKLYSDPGLVKDAGTLRPFLFTAIRNSCINFMKSSQRHTNLEHSDEFDLNFSVNENVIEDREEQERISSFIKKILASLTVRQREIIYLRFLHQMEYEEISGIMDMTEQAARNLVHRAMGKIRKDHSAYDYCLFLILLVNYCK